MFNKNKNGFLKAACLMMSVTMLSACVISGTLAKYVSSGTVTADGMTLTVAKWEVQVNGEPLENTITVTDTEWTIDNIITAETVPLNAAPGTWGYSKVCTITNAGEVDANVTISGISDLATPTSDSDISDGMDFEVVVMENEYPPSSYDLGDFDIGTIATEGVVLTPEDGMTIYICYNWEFDDGSGTNDAADTAMGENQDTFTFEGDLTVTAVQAGG